MSKLSATRSRTQHDLDDPTTERIVDAAFALLCEQGLRSLTVEDIATRAKVSRVTIYRRFTGREAILSAVVAREASALLRRVAAATDGALTLQDRLTEGFVAVVRAARDHPVLHQLLRSDADVVLSLLQTGSQTAVAVGRAFLVTQLADSDSDPIPPVDLDEVAEVTVRLTLSFIVSPSSTIALDSDDDLRRFARRFILPALTHRPETSDPGGPT